MKPTIKCHICTKEYSPYSNINESYGPHHECCSKECYEEFYWRQTLLFLGKDYYPDPHRIRMTQINDLDPQFVTIGPVTTIGELHDALVKIIKWGINKDTSIIFSTQDGNDSIMIDLTDAKNLTDRKVWFI